MPEKTINIGYLARVEGETGLNLKIEDGRVTKAELQIFEPPRFFEAFLRGRAYGEAPDITARICGICPVAYQMSAVHAIENAFGITVDERLHALRRLMYCGEWIESHLLHIYMLHGPDFLGYPDVLQMAKDQPAAVARGLQMKKAGNAIIALLGGREIHPINVRVGGFYRVPTKRELMPLLEPLKQARDAAVDSAHWVAGFPFPDYTYDYEFVALRHPQEYPMNEGRIVSSRGLDCDASQFQDHFVEEQARYSHALQSTHTGHGAYLVGALARYNLNFERLSSLARATAESVGLDAVCRNPFKSIVVRSIEVLYALDEAVRIIESYEPPVAGAELRPVAATGYACTEAPRGLLYHRYRLDEQGQIEEATIIPPTSQNQKMIEEDLRHFAAETLDLPDDQLAMKCEQTIRNYDPCISCATHFLRLNVERS
ncbi:MAG: Ni/Fe hydrogenase subunit alpha [Ktedonobacterales bacterium]